MKEFREWGKRSVIVMLLQNTHNNLVWFGLVVVVVVATSNPLSRMDYGEGLKPFSPILSGKFYVHITVHGPRFIENY